MTTLAKMSVPAGPGLTLFTELGPRELLYPPAQAVLSGARSWLNHPYAMVPGHRMLRLDVHRPAGVEGPVPLVVYASGGAWRLVVKQHGPWKFLPVHGYAVASIEYRLSGEAPFPAPVHDIKAAVRWLRAHATDYGLDPQRIAGWGSSAGGFLMSMAAATNGMPEFEGEVGENLGESSALSCAINHYGPTDLGTLAEDTPNALEPFGKASSPESGLLGCLASSAKPGHSSVASHVSRDTVPFLLMHGDADTRIGWNQTKRLHDALVRVGADTEFHLVPGAEHTDPQFDTARIHNQILAFLNRTIGPGRPPRN